MDQVNWFARCFRELHVSHGIFYDSNQEHLGISEFTSGASVVMRP